MFMFNGAVVTVGNVPQFIEVATFDLLIGGIQWGKAWHS